MSTVGKSSSFAHHTERAEWVLGEIERVTGPDPAVLQLAEFAFAERHDSSGLIALLRNHRVLVSKLLAASAEDWGVPRAAGTVEQIIQLSSVERIFDAALVLEATGGLILPPTSPSAGLKRAEFWRHSLAVACAGRLIAQQLGDRPLAMRAFVCGLFHDLGKLAIDTCLPKSYARVLRRTEAAHRCICDVEQEVLGIDHTVAGKRLLTSWGFPQGLRDCAWLHHHPAHALPGSVALPRLVHVVNLADNLVRRRRLGFSGYHYVETTAAESSHLNLSEEVVERIAGEIPARLEELERFVNLEPQSAPGGGAAASPLLDGAVGQAEAESAPADRSVAARLRCSEAIGRLARSLVGDEGPAAVCRCIVESTCAAFALPAVVAFALPHRSTPCVAAVCADGKTSSETLALSEDQVTSHDTFLRERRSRQRGIDEHHPLFAPLKEHCARILGRHEQVLQLLPIVHGERVAGGLFYVAPPEEAALAEALLEDLEALGAAFAWALAGAQSRLDSVQQAEALAALNRQLHVEHSTQLQEASLGMMTEMAAGAAHELNDPLAVIAGRAQMLRREAEGSDLAPHLDLLDEQARRASAIVSELMQFAKPDPPRARSVAVVDWARRLRQHWQRRSSLGADQIVVTISDPSLKMFVDVDQLDEAAGAIIANAIEATTPENARLSINSASVASDDTVVVSIGDNGRGMTPEVLKHARDPFFSHRPAGRGRGLGLSRAARLLEINAGRLWIDSSPEAGTTVFLSVPARAP